MAHLLRKSSAFLACGLTLSLATTIPPASSAPIASEQTSTSVQDPTQDVEASRFSIALLPDTQFYSRYYTAGSDNQYARFGSEPFTSQTQWIVDNAAKYDIQMTLHLGDIVDRVNQDYEWDNADAAMSILEKAKHPYAILAGNHDVGVDASSTDPVGYGRYVRTFPAERAAKNSTFGGRDPETGAHEYHLLDVDGQKFLIIALSWQAQDNAIAWAQSIIDANPGVPTILTSHQFINISSDGVTPESTEFGEKIWNRLIAPNDQVFLTYNGHHHGATSWARTNNAGHRVYQIVMDYQMDYMGGNGNMGLVEFDLTNGKIHQTTFSPWVIKKADNLLVPFDQGVSAAQNRSFTLDFDFASRFPGLKADGPKSTSPVKDLRDHIANIYKAPEAPVLSEPRNSLDYPVVEGTVAHWRMNRAAVADGTVLPVGEKITDIAGGNTLTRGQGTGVAADGDVTYSTSHARLSSDAGSVCFANAGRRTGPDKKTNTANFFATAADAPANLATFKKGFTFETFLKIDPSFNAADHAWMQWLTREGQRQHVPGYIDSEGEEPPFAWALSTLAEVQFSFVDSKNPPADVSNWSGEIVNKGEWLHLAVVNDPAAATTTMYVDGVPVLRNSVNTIGVGSAGLPWVLGAGSYAGKREAGFVGCIGETRLVEGVLGADKWLTARAQKKEEPTPQAAVVTDEPSAPQLAPDATSSTGVDSTQGKVASKSAKKNTKKLAHTGLSRGDLQAIAGLVCALIGVALVRKARSKSNADA